MKPDHRASMQSSQTGARTASGAVVPATSPSPAILRVDHLTYRYPGAGRAAVSEVSFEVPKGAFVAVLGPNGSGKTTLLQCLCANLRPQSGQISVLPAGGSDAAEAGASAEWVAVSALAPKLRARTMATVHQSTDYTFDFSVYDTVLMGRYPYLGRFRSETAADIAAAEEAMRATAVWELRDSRIHAISGGERQRVMIARALAQDPQVLLLDEPIAHLDLRYQIEVMQLCHALNRRGITVVVTLHDINMASRYADRLMMMKRGELVCYGSPGEVLTAERIADVYGVGVEVLHRGAPYVIPIDALTDADRS